MFNDAMNFLKDDMDEFDENFSKILKDGMPAVVAHKFGKVAMSRWFQFVVLVRQLVFQWSRRFSLYAYYLLGIGGQSGNLLHGGSCVIISLDVFRSGG